MNSTATAEGLATHSKELLGSHPSLNEHERRDVANELQATVADLVDLALIGKQLHWNITGSHFRALHLQLDEFVEAWRLQGDVIAERMSALGISPDGRAATIAAISTVESVPDGPIADDEVVNILTSRLANFSASLSERISRVGEIDPSSEDALIDVARIIDENHWMIAVQR